MQDIGRILLVKIGFGRICTTKNASFQSFSFRLLLQKKSLSFRSRQWRQQVIGTYVRFSTRPFHRYTGCVRIVWIRENNQSLLQWRNRFSLQKIPSARNIIQIEILAEKMIFGSQQSREGNEIQITVRADDQSMDSSRQRCHDRLAERSVERLQHLSQRSLANRLRIYFW